MSITLSKHKNWSPYSPLHKTLMTDRVTTGPRSQDEFSTRTQARTWTRTRTARTAIVYSTHAPYENRFIKICRYWLEIKSPNFYLCFHALDINALLIWLRFAWVLTFFINCLYNKFTLSICMCTVHNSRTWSPGPVLSLIDLTYKLMSKVPYDFNQ
jgi:hypothetical protein